MIRVAVTNLGKYTEGQLVGQWLNLPATDEEIQQVKNAIGINKEYEEIFLPDYKTDIKRIINKEVRQAGTGRILS